MYLIYLFSVCVFIYYESMVGGVLFLHRQFLSLSVHLAARVNC